MTDKKYHCPVCKVPQSLGSGDCPHCFDDRGELVALVEMPEKVIKP
jgi:hypothetical protein